MCQDSSYLSCTFFSFFFFFYLARHSLWLSISVFTHLACFVDSKPAFCKNLLAQIAGHCLSGCTVQWNIIRVRACCGETYRELLSSTLTLCGNYFKWKTWKKKKKRLQCQQQTSKLFKAKRVTWKHNLKLTEQNLKEGRWHLVATAGFGGAWGPIDDDEAKTHYHKQEADSSKTGSLEERSEWGY